MSLFTGQFNYQIEDLEPKIANFYLGKNDGILYVYDFDPIHPSEKEDLYWIPNEYCFKIVNNPDYNNITTIPIYPIPTNITDVKPSYSVNEIDATNITQQVWLFASKFTLDNTIEYIKFYVTEEEEDPNITTNYIFYNIDSNNDLIPITYTAPTIQVNHIEISIKKNGSSVIYNGTWSNIIETYDTIKFKHNNGYDYKYKYRLDLYESVFNNITIIKGIIESNKDTLSAMSVIISNINTALLIEPVYILGDLSIGINSDIHNAIRNYVTELQTYITNSTILYKTTDLPTNDGLSYIVAPSTCSDIINSANLEFELKYLSIDLELLSTDLEQLNNFQSTYKFLGIHTNPTDHPNSAITQIDDVDNDMTDPAPGDQIKLNINIVDSSPNPDNQYIIEIESNVEQVTIYYTIDGTDPTVSNFYSNSLITINDPHKITFNINKYQITYTDLLSYIYSDTSIVNTLSNVLTFDHEQDINAREYYISILNHFEIFNLNNYKISTGTWYPNCSTDCLESSVSVSLKKLKYTSNLSNIEHILNNIKEIYHIGELQKLLINEIIEIIEKYNTSTIAIDLNDPDDPILKAFQEICKDIILNIDNIAKYAIYNNTFIFNHTNNTEPLKLTYNFNSISNNYSSGQNSELVFQLPYLDSTAIHINDLDPDPNTTNTLYNEDINTTNINTIIGIYQASINLLETKKSTFESLKIIINLRIKLLIDYILYTKNLLDD